MKALKYIAIILVVLLLIAGGFVIYVMKTAKVEVISIASSGQSAAMDVNAFEELVEAVRNESFIGTLYQTPSEWKTAEDYAYLTYEVTLRNGCYVPIDMVEIQIVPISSDILQLGDLTVKSLNEQSEGTFKATILAAKDAHMMREVIVTYYVWGVSFAIRTNSGLKASSL